MIFIAEEPPGPRAGASGGVAVQESTSSRVVVQETARSEAYLRGSILEIMCCDRLLR